LEFSGDALEAVVFSPIKFLGEDEGAIAAPCGALSFVPSTAILNSISVTENSLGIRR
jgi:hypothetical protein